MDTSDDQSNEDCSLTDDDEDCPFVLTDIGEWVALNPDRLDKVFDLELELPDEVDNIDSIGYLCNLHSLTIKRGISLNSLPDCLYDLKVHHVRLEGCHVKSFSATPIYLETLEIINCLYVGDILASLKDLDCLNVLKIQGYHMECLPDSIAQICGLGVLELQDCINLKKFPQNLGQLVTVYTLKLVNCGIDCIPSGLCNLYYLRVENCPMEFPVTKDCVSLTCLVIRSCCVESVHGYIIGLTKLIALTLEDCVGEELPTAINTLVSLQYLCIDRCSSIKFLPSLAALQKLRELSLKGCSSLNELPTHFDKLTNLSSLDLRDTNIQSFSSTITNLPKLRCIQLPLCFRLETLPNDLDLNVIAVFLPESFRLDTLPAEFSSVQRDYQVGYRLYWKAAPSKQADGESHQEESRQVVISKQRTVNTPLNLTQLLPDYAVDVGTNIIGEADSYMTSEAGQSDALNLVNPGGRHHLSQESEGAPYRKHKKATICEEQIKSLMDEGINQKAAAKRLNVSLATLKRYRRRYAFSTWPSKRIKKFNCDLATGSKPSPLDSAISTDTVYQEHSEHLHSSSTINATNGQVCQVNGGCTETCSVEAPDGRSNMLVVKATYKDDDIIRFDFLSTSSLAKLKEEVLLRLPLEETKMKMKYQDEDKDWVLLACTGDLQHCLRLSMSFRSNIIRLKIFDT